MNFYKALPHKALIEELILGRLILVLVTTNESVASALICYFKIDGKPSEVCN
jgi:hypothetical protein